VHHETELDALEQGPNANIKNSEIDFKKHHMVPQCSSCGIQLQKSDHEEIGYYQEPKNETKSYHSKKLQYLSAFSKLDEEGKKLLNISETMDDPDEAIVQKEEELICLRCHNALYHNIFKVDEHQSMNLEEVVSPIPLTHQLIHVFSAYDFPLSLVSFKNRKNVTYVMNKVDLLTGFESVANRYSNYFTRMLQRLTGENKLHIVSAHTSWSVGDLLRKMGNVNYLVGFVNTGKTRLANRLLNISAQIHSPGMKNIRPTGSSHLPALTRDNITHRCADKKVIDTPGFLDNDNVFSLIKEDQLKSTLQGKKILINDLRMARYESVKGGQCFTVGGLFFLVPPNDTILQVIPVCKGEPRVFSNLEKAVATVKTPPEALKKSFLVKAEAIDDLVRYVIPPFFGTIDLLIKDIGYVQIKPTGKKSNDALFEVWAPRGLILGVRETIEHFMTRYIKKQRKKKLRNGEEKEVLKMKPKTIPDYKIFSRLYEIPKSCADPMDEVKVQYQRHIREYGESYNRWRHHDKRDESRNEYWIEKL
jgi:ribosome biogenesis GTPase A